MNNVHPKIATDFYASVEESFIKHISDFGLKDEGYYYPYTCWPQKY